MTKTPPREVMTEIGELTAYHYNETQEQVKAYVIAGDMDKLEQMGFNNLYECKKFLEEMNWSFFQDIANALLEVYNENNKTTYDQSIGALIAGLCKKENWDELVRAGTKKQKDNILLK